tara:strand:- start:142 stop:2232 length:2091 start_codon:yes stop_codon:yes gene_type:complete
MKLAKADEVFVLDSKSQLQIIDLKYVQFLEGYDELSSFEQLQKAVWQKEMSNNQSFVEGYWVKFLVRNELESTKIGLWHNLNFEKKLFVNNSLGLKEYPFWKYLNNHYVSENQMGSHYRLVLPQQEVSVIYNFFRSKPFNRNYSSKNGLDRLMLGNWKDVQNRETISVVIAIGFIAISFAFALYYFFIFLVSGGNYFLISMILLLATAITLTTYPIGMYLGVSLWWSFSAIRVASYALLFILLLQFFRNTLNLSNRYQLINKIFIIGIIFYSVLIPIYVIESLSWPEAEEFNDLLRYPPDNRGAGFIPLPIMLIPFSMLLITSILISFKLWREGDSSAGYLCLSFSLPFLALPMWGVFFVFKMFGLGTIYMIAVARILFLAMFITFGFAVAQRMNELKKMALEQQMRLTEAYQRFVPSQLLSSLEKESILDVELGDQVEKEMSILFSDIRSFTALSESMTPEENFGFINSYLSIMGPLVRKHHGYIDKYVGDSIMALFDRTPDDAVQTSVSMFKALSEFNKERLRSGKEEIHIGIGINTGMLIFGTLGEKDRMEGSVISDAVNLAARLEGLTKLYKTQLLISEVTFKKLTLGVFKARLIDKVAVKGKETSVLVYEVLDAETPELFKKKQDTIKFFEQGWNLYQNQRFEEAQHLFCRCLELAPEDTVANLYVERCKILISGGWNTETWDGVNRMETK